MWVLVPPRFVAELESQAVAQNSTVLFRSVFEGTSPLTVKWFKDGMELVPGPRCSISRKEYSSSVELPAVGMQHSGVYSCHVSNAAGVVHSAGELLVKGWTSFLSSSHHHNSLFFIPST